MTSPAHRGPRDSWFPTPSHRPPQSLPPLETPAQHPPSGPIPPSPGHVNQQCVHHYREPRLTHHPNNNRDLGAVAVGTRSRGRRHRNTGELGGLLCDREPTLHKALSSIMGAYHHSPEKFQETQRLQEEQYMGFREELRTINSTLGTIVGVLKELVNTRRDTVALQGAPDTSRAMNCPPPPPALVDRRHRHRTTTPAPHPLQRENHLANCP
ncbi:hypothetical protein NDU88_002317 [Pleurodeles waltl]|uniref:Uncharacterized protein n=1 Tax=Pleurodeles waltl TaxID=8319 RepID=A0AAV7TMS3_PLEWA|nr:hypothetical protein NDU88_002317 [Pleurodeles waltl]